jgi:hypothetical protein
MQGIYNYIPEANHFSKVYKVAAILWLEFMLYVILFPMINVSYFYIIIIIIIWVLHKT